MKKLDTLKLSTTPVVVRPGVQAVALDADPGDALFTRHRLHPQSADDHLLASYYGFLEAHPGGGVLILSADSGLATKARSRCVELVAPDETLELPDEPDELERELAQTRRELAEVRSAAPDLRLTFGQGDTHARWDIQLVTAIDGQKRRQLLAAWRKKYQYVEGTRQRSLGPPGRSCRLKASWAPSESCPRRTPRTTTPGVDRVFER